MNNYTHFVEVLRNHACAYCGEGVDRATIDHMLARARGGRDSLENLVPACRTCNQMKGTLTPTQFMARCRKIAKMMKKTWTFLPGNEAKWDIWDVMNERARAE